MPRASLYPTFVNMLSSLGFGAASPDHTVARAPTDAPRMTRWGKNVRPGNGWARYPRPQLERSNSIPLNGLWRYAIQKRQTNRSKQWSQRILLPFAVEAALSDVGQSLETNQRLRYQPSFDVCVNNEKTLLHVRSVDCKAIVWGDRQRVMAMNYRTDRYPHTSGVGQDFE